jgi:hypothetical protein
VNVTCSSVITDPCFSNFHILRPLKWTQKALILVRYCNAEATCISMDREEETKDVGLPLQGLRKNIIEKM